MNTKAAGVFLIPAALIMAKPKLVVEVSGGVVVNVYSDQPVNVEVWDWDNKREEGHDWESPEFKAMIEGLQDVW